MDPIEKRERQRQARRRLRAQRRRAGLLRSRVIASALIGFVLLWGIVFVQMATGNDPVLGDRPAAVAAVGKGRHHGGEAARPEELEARRAGEREAAAAATEPEVEPEPIVEPEVEPEPVTTSQS